MIIRENYLKKMIDAKDTDFIKVITGMKRTGKSTLLLMFRDYLLANGVKEENIVHINFESAKYDDIKDYKDLYKYIEDKVKDEKIYLLLDEIQSVSSWEKAINSFKVDFNMDIYITGSNAYLLSSELSTLLSGRYIEIKMYPLSFKEFLVFNNVGSPISTKKISDYLNSNKVVQKSNHQTIDNYLNMLEKSYIIYKADRTDVKSKSLLKTLGKYYVSDSGIRNIILGFRNINEGHLLENIVYLELLRRGYRVNIGKIGDYEAHFVAENPHTIRYYQVAQSISDEDVRVREIRSLENIPDNYEKIILSMDKSINNDYNGIKVRNIISWLLDSEE